MFFFTYAQCFSNLRRLTEGAFSSRLIFKHLNLTKASSKRHKIPPNPTCMYGNVVALRQTSPIDGAKRGFWQADFLKDTRTLWEISNVFTILAAPFTFRLYFSSGQQSCRSQNPNGLENLPCWEWLWTSRWEYTVYATDTVDQPFKQTRRLSSKAGQVLSCATITAD